MPEQDIEQQEAIISDENQEIDINLDDTENVEATEKTYSAQEFKQVLARAKKAETDLKALKSKPADPSQLTTPAPSTDTVDERILKAQKIPDDEIAYLKKIAKVNETSMIEAMNDPLYEGYKAKKESEEKAQKARLGASRGSGTAKKSKDFNTPGLTPEEHRAMFRDRTN